jgi:hypothetical protein
MAEGALARVAKRLRELGNRDTILAQRALREAHAPFGQISEWTDAGHLFEMKGEGRTRHACDLRQFDETPVFARSFVN